MDEIACVKDIEQYAYRILPKNALDYYKSGATAEDTLHNTKSAFLKWKIRPRMLRDVSQRDLHTTILGTQISMPIGIAPTALQRMAHSDGECASAKAAEKMGTIFILSTIATSSIEEVAEAAPQAIKWFQLYIYKDREITKKLVQRAEKAGFKAIVLTVDAPVFGIRRADIRNKFTLPPHLKLANFIGDKSGMQNNKMNNSAINSYVNKLFDQSLHWRDIKWLKSITNLPIILKGILTAEDAIEGMEQGVAGIIVSNHGARQIDSVPASIEALPEIVKAVGDRVEVYIDGGFTEGTDVFKALALGAKMVFVGRPVLWGLAYKGEEGAQLVLNFMKLEFDRALSLSGCMTLKDITRNMIAHKSFYAHL